MEADLSAAGLRYREALPAGGPVGTALLLHGYPESSHMWHALLPELAATGWRAVAPDLAGFGDSPVDRPGTWERHVESVERFRTELGLERVALVVHDWGGLIGLRWACDHPEAIRAFVISATGFFTDRKWHDVAAAMRTEGTGEQLMDNLTRELLQMALSQSSTGIDDAAMDEYWKGFATPDHRAAMLELYRSGDFEKLEPYQGMLAALGVPTLLVWGADDRFASVDASARRFERDIPGAELALVEGVGHFVFDDAPAAANARVTEFLGRV